MVGRGIVSRLIGEGHDVVGMARNRPQNWPGPADFVAVDIRDATGVRRAVGNADAVVHCAWTACAGADQATREVNVGGTANVIDAMSATGIHRIVFTSSVHVYGARAANGQPVPESDDLAPTAGNGYGVQKAQAEALLRSSGAQWVAVRSGVVLGRDVNNRLLHLLAAPLLFDIDGSGDHRLPVVHTDDIHRLAVLAVLRNEISCGPVNLAASGEVTLRDIAAAVGRPLIRLPKPLRGIAGAKSRSSGLGNCPVVDTTKLHSEWGFAPAWSASECVEDFALSVRGRVGLGDKVFSLPWRLARVRDVPAIDGAASDGAVPTFAGPEGCNGEFDTPIDPRFPTFFATNLSEALPGPFSPSSASVTVLGARAGGVTIAQRLRPGGLVQREMATRTVGVFGHRLYAAVTSAYFMAQTVPFTDPKMVLGQFFGRAVVDMPIFGPERPPQAKTGVVQQIRNIGIFAGNLVGLSAGSVGDTRDFIADVDRLERSTATRLGDVEDRRLLSLILSARDHVVHGWVLASASIMLCSAYSVILRILTGRDTTPPVGPEVVSARSLDAMHRLVVAARLDPVVLEVLAEPGEHLDELSGRAPRFHAAVLDELDLIGHRGPAEVEMRSLTYADDPELLVRMVAKSLNARADAPLISPAIPLWARPIALLSARQLRDREARRDKMVRAIWVLRRLLREQGRRMAAAGVIRTADDVFYLLVDELEAVPRNTAELVTRRRAEQRSLAAIVPPAAFCGHWDAAPAAAMLAVGESLYGLGICGGRVRGRVRIVRPETIDELQPGEILVAQVTDVGYTPAFAYAAAVVTEIGGPMSHAAVVAREFGFPSVVDVRDATRRLAPGALVEVDGATGEIRVLGLDPALPQCTELGQVHP